MSDCVTPISRGRNFCRNQINNLDDPNSPNSVLRYRTITGICNNIEPGQTTVGARETVLPRLRRKLQNAQFQSVRYKKSFLPLLKLESSLREMKQKQVLFLIERAA